MRVEPTLDPDEFARLAKALRQATYHAMYLSRWKLDMRRAISVRQFEFIQYVQVARTCCNQCLSLLVRKEPMFCGSCFPNCNFLPCCLRPSWLCFGPTSSVYRALGCRSKESGQRWAVLDSGHDGAWLRQRPSSALLQSEYAVLVGIAASLRHSMFIELLFFHFLIAKTLDVCSA